MHIIVVIGQSGEEIVKKNVWILNHYAGGMPFSQGGRHFWFAKYLRKEGYSPVVFVSNSKHNPGTETFYDIDGLWEEHYDQEIETPFVYVKARKYSGNGLARVLNMLDFYRNVKIAAKQYAKQYSKPDIIYASSVHPLTLVAGIELARKFKIKCICEVRDLWPESIVEYSDRWTKNNIIMKMLYLFEKNIYKKADTVIFTFEGGTRYIKDKGWQKDVTIEKVKYINNGIDIKAFDQEREQYVVNDKDLDRKDVVKIVYTGSIRLVNNVDIILDTAKLLNPEKYLFLIWGNGTEIERLESRVEDEKITNVIFKGRVNKTFIPNVLSRADICFANSTATQLGRRYGLSLNKIFEYLASGKPSVCNIPSDFNPIAQEKAGIVLDEPTPSVIASTIEKIAELPKTEYEQFCINARRGAEKYDFEKLTEKLIDIIETT